jgi:hypothetical protein
MLSYASPLLVHNLPHLGQHESFLQSPYLPKPVTLLQHSWLMLISRSGKILAFKLSELFNLCRFHHLALKE